MIAAERAARRGLAALLSTSLAGCSFLLMDKPPDRVDAAYPVCSEGPGAPLADVALGAIAGLIAFGIWQDDQGRDDPISDEDRNALIAFSAAGVLHVTSAAFGAGWMSDCRAKRAAWERGQVRYGRPSDPRPLTSPTAIPPPPRPVRGGRGEPCYPNDTCNAGLTCDLAARTCAAAPAPPASPPPPPP